MDQWGALFWLQPRSGARCVLIEQYGVDIERSIHGVQENTLIQQPNTGASGHPAHHEHERDWEHKRFLARLYFVAILETHLFGWMHLVNSYIVDAAELALCLERISSWRSTVRIFQVDGRTPTVVYLSVCVALWASCSELSLRLLGVLIPVERRSVLWT